MKLTNQKRIAATLLKVGIRRVLFDKEKLKEIKEAITKEDIRNLIKEKAITKKPEIGISSFRSKKNRSQKRKGRRKGKGSREGRRKARLPRKKAWMLKIRTQRKLLKLLKERKLITPQTYNLLYRRSKGNFFRSRRHIKLYLEDHDLIVKNDI